MSVKGILKEIARPILFVLKRKRYKFKFDEKFVDYSNVGDDSYECFYGYYDRSPEKGDRILFHEMMPDKKTVRIVVKDALTNQETIVGTSKAFNWQMGARALWISDDILSYNDFEGGRYVSKWVNVSSGEVIKTIPMPTMDIYKEEFILSPNFQRLRSVDPHYSYNCLPEMDETMFDDYDHDGIWEYDIERNQMKLLLSISEVLKCKGKLLHESGKHCVNHIMIAPDGKSFIFIHRYLYDGKKFDRLMCYDFKGLRCLLDDPVQSHFCWLDSDNIMGYCESKGEIGWFEANTKSGKVKKLEELTRIHPKNGHPTPYGDWIIVDSYPDLSRMQTIHAYNRKTKEVVLLAELYHDLRHKDYDRCDLHPRFSEDGRTIYIDTIYSGRRELLALNISRLLGGGKTLILIDNLYYMYSLDGKERNAIRFLPLMRKSGTISKAYRVCRKLHLSSNLPCKEIWLNNWTRILYKYDTIILGETGNSYNVAKYIKRKYPQKRIIIWFRNSLSHTINPARFDENVCETWSFDEADCNRYNLRYNPQFYVKSPSYRENGIIKYDAFFIGKDKGRLEDILSVESFLKGQGLKTKFCIVGYNSDSIEYKQVLDYISESKAIVDIQGDWQDGITLRPLEALFYEKKLISNSKGLLDVDFYRPNNIFILGADDISKIETFLNAPYEKVDAKILKKYDLEG